jgi:hypothetical protein
VAELESGNCKSGGNAENRMKKGVCILIPSDYRDETGKIELLSSSSKFMFCNY